MLFRIAFNCPKISGIMKVGSYIFELPTGHTMATVTQIHVDEERLLVRTLLKFNLFNI